VPEGEGWQQWLGEHRSFSFYGRNGQINVLKEKRSRGGDGYWYAYQRQGKQMLKRYTGRGVQLGVERLEEIASLLTAEAKKEEPLNTPLAVDAPTQFEPLLLIAGVILFAGAGGLTENALRGLTSRMVGPQEQGRVAGAGQSLASMAMILAPLFGGVIYTQWGHFETYGAAALIIVLAIVSVMAAMPALRKHKAGMEAGV
jgi:hypothetical protein